MFSGIEPLCSLQRVFSKAQIIPLIGPIVVSPVKAIVGLVEIVAGSVLGLLSGVFGTIFLSRPLLGCSVTSLKIACHGALSVIYAVGNLLSLSILGWIVEITPIQI